jgi:hypothetical protein
LNLTSIKISLYLIVTIVFITLALFKSVADNSQLFASLAIIIGAIGSQYVTNLNTTNEKIKG